YIRRFYARARLLQAVTEEDAASLRQALAREVALRPAIVEVPPTPVAPDRTPPRALFLGDYSHAPNPEAATVLVPDVLPRLRAAMPDAELWLAGPNQERLNGVRSTPGVRVVGFAPDLAGLFGEVRLMLAPLYSGGGFRMKSITALAHGLPVVTNALGARGCDAPAPARTVADDLGALVDAAVRLLREPALAGTAGRAAHAWAREHLSPDAVAGAGVARVDPLLRRCLAPPAGCSASACPPQRRDAFGVFDSADGRRRARRHRGGLRRRRVRALLAQPELAQRLLQERLHLR